MESMICGTGWKVEERSVTVVTKVSIKRTRGVR